MIRIFIVDDHPLVIEGISSVLTRLPNVNVVGHAATAGACLGFFATNTADIILLDINLPDQNGIDLCRVIIKNNPKQKIIALTNFDQLTYIQNMKEAGAVGYLLKNSSPEIILKAIQLIMDGKEYWLGRVSLKESIKEQNHLMLTRREIEVLQLIAEGLTNQEIADKLFVSASTIDSHRKNLLAKLHVKNTAALVRVAFENKII
jgi:DNA-binding NarL/FixJ family response regulator